MVSNTRPDQGTRARFTSGPSITLVPLPRCSAPMALPQLQLLIKPGDHAIDTVDISCDGH